MSWWNRRRGGDQEDTPAGVPAGPPGAAPLRALPRPAAPLTAAAARQLAPLTLAHVGDAVYDLHVRTHLALAGPVKPRDLHRRTVSYVRATAQAAALRTLVPALTEDETDVVRRARNARPGHVPKGVAAAEYAQATGLEALLGYLYLTGQSERLAEVLAAAVAAAPV